MPDTPATRQAQRRDFVVVSTTQFFLAFALNFMLVFLPFYVHRISTLEEDATLRWLGLIMGAAPAMATFGSAFWGGLTDRFGPKGLFERGMLSHAILVILMGFTTDLRLLFAIRVVQGFFGGISTIGLIIVAASSDEGELARRMGVYQSALTLGQIFAPPLGAMAAAAFGFRGAFLTSGLMLFVVCLCCHLALSRIPPRPKPTVAAAIPRRQIWLAWLVSLVGTMHIIFLPSVLPTILRGFEVPESQGLVTAGTIVFAYGIAAVAGSYGFSRLAGRVPAGRLVLVTASGASICQLLLYFGTDAVTFTLIRMMQTGCAAGIFPLILAQLATRAEGKTIGFINTARFAGNALGPVAATFILAHSDLFTLYLVLGAGLALASVGHRLGSGAPPERPA
jgi:DHA1 family multidrug resistance protein-like MFS transporter